MKACYRISDDFGEIIVSEQGNTRILSFDSSLQQTCVNIEKPYMLVHEYTRIMLLGQLFVDAKNIMLLGLGGGALANCLSFYCPDIKITAIELRSCVIDVAYDWFGLSRVENLMVVCADASAYLHKVDTNSVDLLFSDLYDKQGMSEIQSQITFIDTCFQALCESGCLVINFHMIPDSNSLLMKKINALFVSVFVCDVFKGNQVIFCCKLKQDIAEPEIKKELKVLENKMHISLLYYFNQLHEL